MRSVMDPDHDPWRGEYIDNDDDREQDRWCHDCEEKRGSFWFEYPETLFKYTEKGHKYQEAEEWYLSNRCISCQLAMVIDYVTENKPRERRRPAEVRHYFYGKVLVWFNQYNYTGRVKLGEARYVRDKMFAHGYFDDLPPYNPEAPFQRAPGNPDQPAAMNTRRAGKRRRNKVNRKGRKFFSLPHRPKGVPIVESDKLVRKYADMTLAENQDWSKGPESANSSDPMKGVEHEGRKAELGHIDAEGDVNMEGVEDDDEESEQESSEEDEDEDEDDTEDEKDYDEGTYRFDRHFPFDDMDGPVGGP
ncbi:MAG: hypothetical protein M1831_001036 [Alyxoria varia]|nr:MAG: hypothetical protein M1831_001036 [Alyxoria varia]